MWVCRADKFHDGSSSGSLDALGADDESESGI
jgi:hypothetical protein